MKKIKVITITALAAITGIIILQNMEPVETKLLFVSVSMPRALFIVLIWLVGLICGLMIPLKPKWTIKRT